MEGFAERCGEYVRNEALASLNETIIANVARDAPKGVRYARVTTGRSDCAFCLMLESRGAVYHSRKTAGEMKRYHRGCDCKVVPGVGDDEFTILVEGHDPREAYDRWQELEKEAEATREEKRRRKQAAGLEKVRREAASMTEDARAILGNRELASIIDSGTLSELADRVSDAGRSKDKARNMAARLFTMAITSGDKIRLTDHDGSFFSPHDGKVHLDAIGIKDARTIVHEFGHFLDFKLGKSIYASTRSPLLNYVKLQENAKTKSWSKLCGSLDATNDKEAKEILFRTIKEYGVYGVSEMSVSDIIHAISNGRVLLSYGHFDGYWNNRTRVVEIWAEFMAMILMNENESSLIRRILPDESAILEQFLEKMNDEIRL